MDKKERKSAAKYILGHGEHIYDYDESDFETEVKLRVLLSCRTIF